MIIGLIRWMRGLVRWMRGFGKVDDRFDKMDEKFDSMRQLIFWSVTGGVAFLTIMLGVMTYILRVTTHPIP